MSSNSISIVASASWSRWELLLLFIVGLSGCESRHQQGITLALEKIPNASLSNTLLSNDNQTFCGTAQVQGSSERLFYAGLVEKRVYLEGEYGFTPDGYEVRCDTRLGNAARKALEERMRRLAEAEDQKALSSAAKVAEDKWLQKNADALRSLHEANRR